MGIRDEMPLLARHEGQWEGTYRFVDPAGETIDVHEARLTNTMPDGDGPFPELTEAHADWDYFQVNEYRWPDGREERLEFPATYADGAIHFDTDRMKGHAWEVDGNCIVLTWIYKEDPTVSLYELIHLDESGNHRTRTWHWFKSGVCFQRTLIDEKRVA